jgi:hypothetical protein
MARSDHCVTIDTGAGSSSWRSVERGRWGPRPTPAGQRKGEFRRRSTAPPPTDPGVDPLGRRVPYKEDFPRRGRGIRFSRVWYVRLGPGRLPGGVGRGVDVPLTRVEAFVAEQRLDLGGPGAVFGEAGGEREPHP